MSEYHSSAQSSFEPNDTSEQAIPVVNGQSVEESIHALGDVDWFKFTVPLASPRLRLETSGAAGDTEMWLYGPNDLVLLSYDHDGSAFSLIVRTNGPSLAPGTYYVKIRARENASLISNYVFRASWGGLKPQTLKWIAPANAQLSLNTPIQLAAEADSGREVTFRVIKGPAILEAGSVTITNAGAVQIRAEVEGNSTYAPTNKVATFNAPVETFGVLGSLPRTPGYPAGDLQVVGSLAFNAISDGGIQIIDISDLTEPKVVGSLDTSGSASSIQVLNQLAYVADKSGGLQIINVSDPHSPTWIGGYTTARDALGLHVVGSYAYVAVGLAGLQIIDVSDPASPTLAAGFDTFGSASRVQVVRNLAYVADGSAGLEIIDVSIPAAPVLAGRFRTSGSVDEITVVDGLAYVAVRGQGLEIIDVSNPASPAIVGEYLADRIAHVQVVDQRVLLGGSYGLEVIDVTSPEYPLFLGSFLPSKTIEGAQVIGDKAFLEVAGVGLEIVQLGVKQVQTLSFALPSSVSITNSPLTLDASSSAGLPVSFSVISGPATIDGGQLIFSGPGQVTVRAFQAGNGMILPAMIDELVSVRLLPQTIHWEKPAGDPLEFHSPYPLAADSDSLLPVSYRVVSGSAFISGGSLTVTNYGRVEIAAEQAGSAIYEPSSVTRGFEVVRSRIIERGVWPKFARGYSPSGIQEAGGYVYITDLEVGLQTVDARDPLNPVQIGAFKTSGTASGVQVVGRYAYVPDGESGLQIIDVSDPRQPVGVGDYKTQGKAVGVHIVGTTAYVADEKTGLHIIDISDVTNPVRLGNFGGGSLAVKVVGGLAYVASGSAGLKVINVRNPAKPLLIGTYKQFISPSGSATALDVVEDVVYLSVGAEGLQIINVGTPSKPALVGSLLETDPKGTNNSVQVVDGVAYVADEGAGLISIDVRHPATPGRGSIHYLGRMQTARVHINGKYAYVLDRAEGLRIVQLLGYFSAPQGKLKSIGRAVEVQIDNRLAYLADGPAGLQILDVTDADNPVRIGGFLTGGFAKGIHLVDHLAYVAALNGGLQIIDVQNPSEPLRLGVYSNALNFFAEKVYVVGTNAYVANGGKSVSVLNVSNPAKPTLYKDVPLSGVVDLQVSESFAYFAVGSSGLRIFGTTNGLSPFTLGSFGGSGRANALQATGRFSYVAYADSANSNLVSKLRVLDVIDPRKPQLAGEVGTLGGANDLHVLDQYAYIAELSAGVQFVDVRNPSVPVSLGSFKTPQPALGVRTDGRFVYVADGAAGLKILEFRPGQEQSMQFDIDGPVHSSDSPLTLHAASDSRLLVKYSVVSGPALLDGDRLTLTGVGKVTLRAQQVGNDHFLPVSVEKTIDVLPEAIPLLLNFSSSGTEIEFHWAVQALGYKLQQTVSLTQPVLWEDVVAPSEQANGEQVVKLPPPTKSHFYRLMKP